LFNACSLNEKNCQAPKKNVDESIHPRSKALGEAYITDKLNAHLSWTFAYYSVISFFRPPSFWNVSNKQQTLFYHKVIEANPIESVFPLQK